MDVLLWNTLDDVQKAGALTRPRALMDGELSAQVGRIVGAVRERGDEALAAFTQEFDGVVVKELKIPSADLKAAWEDLPRREQEALEIAKANIESFHIAQIPRTIEVETMPGVVCRREPRPLDSAGLYVPGGSAPLISSLMMLAIPAKIAGVGQCIVVTPPGKDGNINARILAAAYLCGIQDVFAVGGAQAIAALGFGTQSIPKVAKIFGPGNAYVAMAKSLLAQEPGGPATDLPAGPSEAMVFADGLADVSFVAADLLSQAEHDPLAQVICVCDHRSLADEIQRELEKQLVSLPRREIAAAALENAKIIVVDGRDDMVEIANIYAPEHLIIQTENPEDMVGAINNAGSIFIGPWSPEAVGDYASGTNHTLPTFGAARSYSGLILESFMKFISVQKLTRSGLELLGPCVETLADMEGLEAHKRAVSIRLNSRKALS